MSKALVSLTLSSCLGCCLIAVPARSEAPGALTKPPVVAECFRGDKRLAVPIDVAEKNRPLGEWLRSLGGGLNVKLAASREAADHKITLLLDRRPAAEVLTLAARHLSFEWSGDKSGYTLVEGDRTRAENDRQRREQWAAIQRWMDRLGALAARPAAELAARRFEVDKALADSALEPARRTALVEEQTLLRDLSRHSKAVPVILRIYQSLRPLQLEQLRSTGFLRLASAYGSLSPEVVAATHEAFGPQGVEPPPDTPRNAELCFLLEEVAQEAAHPNGARQLRLRLELVAGMPGRSSTSVNWRSRTPPPGGAPTSPTFPADDPDFQRTVEMKLAPAKRALELQVAGAAAYTLQRWQSGLVPVAQVAEALHAEGKLEVVADSFMRARLDPARLSGKKTVAEILTLLADELDFTWRKEGRVLLLTSRSRAYDRDAEAPERIIRPFRARVLSQPAATLDDLAQLAGSLTDSQCRGLTDCWGWYFEGNNIPPPWVSGGIYEARYHLRLWGSLTPAQRRDALKDRLSVEAMSGIQKRLCGLALSAPGDDLIGLSSIEVPTVEALPRLSAAFTLRPREVDSQTHRDDEGEETADIVPVGSPGINEFNRRRFGGRPRVAVGPSTRMLAFDFIYYVTDGTVPPRIARSINLHLVPRWP